jgi:hypothetical protein
LIRAEIDSKKSLDGVNLVSCHGVDLNESNNCFGFAGDLWLRGMEVLEGF